MQYPDVAVFQGRDFQWYWRFKWTDTTIDGPSVGYPTKAAAWRGVVHYLITRLKK